MKIYFTNTTNRKYLAYKLRDISPIQLGNILLTKYINRNTFNEEVSGVSSLAFEKARDWLLFDLSTLFLYVEIELCLGSGCDGFLITVAPLEPDLFSTSYKKASYPKYFLMLILIYILVFGISYKYQSVMFQHTNGIFIYGLGLTLMCHIGMWGEI